MTRQWRGKASPRRGVLPRPDAPHPPQDPSGHPPLGGDGTKGKGLPFDSITTLLDFPLAGTLEEEWRGDSITTLFDSLWLERLRRSGEDDDDDSNRKASHTRRQGRRIPIPPASPSLVPLLPLSPAHPLSILQRCSRYIDSIVSHDPFVRK